MLRSIATRHVVSASKQLILLTVVLSFLAVIPGVTMIFAAKDLLRNVNAEYAPGDIHPVVLEWMKNNSKMPEHVLADIYRAAVSNGNSDLILAICLVESNFNPNVKSDKGAIGLMGILPQAWLDELQAQGIVQNKNDLYHIPTNIAAGAYVLQKYLSNAKTLERALINYVGGDPAYVRKVLKALRELYLAKWSRPETA
jgi:soluble lytic murein transglycosylase-like protein